MSVSQQHPPIDLVVDGVSTVDLMRELLSRYGVDLDDPNFAKTPERFVSYLEEHLIAADPPPLEWSTFPSAYTGLVIERDIRVDGACPHHLLPVAYSITLGYLVGGKVVGLSKLARAARHFGQRAQLQEDITEQIADELERALDAKGIGVIITGRHACMAVRGVRSAPVVTTSTVRGMLQTLAVREEFLQLVQHGRE